MQVQQEEPVTCEVVLLTFKLRLATYACYHYLKPVKKSQVRSCALAEKTFRAIFVAKEVVSAVCLLTGCCWAVSVHTLALVMLGATCCDLKVYLYMKLFSFYPLIRGSPREVHCFVKPLTSSWVVNSGLTLILIHI